MVNSGAWEAVIDLIYLMLAIFSKIVSPGPWKVVINLIFWVLFTNNVLRSIVGRFRRQKPNPRSGTLEVISDGVETDFELVGAVRSCCTFH